MATTWAQTPDRDAKIDFARQIQPLLSENCYFCHGPDEANRAADLRLDIEKKANEVVEPRHPDQSELFRRIMSDDQDERMPPPDSNRRLTSEQQMLIKEWIEQGAHWSQHWAFTPITKPKPPRDDEVPVYKNPIDSFVERRLSEADLRLSKKADRRTLIRRVAIDLTGLPPTPGEVEQFLGDDSPEAYRNMIDRYFASPAYGERMAWPWLDAARYADSNGYQQDADRTMWPWRDWVVKAFNQNLPFDQFSIWQLSGDQLPSPTHEHRLATAFLRNHPINGEGGRIAEENRVDYVMDMTETTGSVWLGLTLNCCRCHDHKYDQLSQKEYYQLSAFFNQTPVTGDGGNPQTAPVLAAPTPKQSEELERLLLGVNQLQRSFEQRLDYLETRITKKNTSEIPKSLAGIVEDQELSAALNSQAGKRTKEQQDAIHTGFAKVDAEFSEILEQLTSRKKKLEQAKAAIPKVMVMQEMPKKRQTFLLERGSYEQQREVVEADVPAMLPALPSGDRNRLSLARWLFEPENPLTARVAVNRLWEQVFGTGLVKTMEDFGVQGEPPSHPELLDWLAAEYRSSGWDTKHLLRLILTSETYQQVSKANAKALEIDPENRLLSRGPRYRMPSWMIRDYALAASGQLIQQVGGPPVNSYQPPGVWEEASFGTKKYTLGKGDELYRRSIYTFWRRISAPTLFFDNADRMACAVNRNLTNTPLHALTTLNDTTFVEASRILAARVLDRTAFTNRVDDEQGSASQLDRARLDLVFVRLLARPAHERESNTLLKALNRTRQEFQQSPESAFQLIAVGQTPSQIAVDEKDSAIELASWTTLCLAVLNLDETLTRQ